MKRSYRIVLAVIMMLLMVISSASMGFAASGTEGQTKADEASITSPEIPDLYQSINTGETADKIQDMLSANEDTGDLSESEDTRGLSENFPVHRILNYSDVTLKPDVTLKAQYSYNGDYYAQSAVVQLKKGTLYLSGFTDDDIVEVAVIDKSNDSLIGYGSFYRGESNRRTVSFDIPRTGNYFLQAVTDTSNTWTFLRATLAVDLQGLYLGNNKYYVVGHSTDAQTRTYKFYPKATGYMKVIADDDIKVTLCNASGKVIAKQVTVKYYPVFGVRADRTYILKVSWPSGSVGMNRIKVDNGSWWPTNGVSKAKATPMSKGKLKKGLVVAGENNVRWFKYTNWSSTLKVTLTGRTNDQLVWYIYEGSTLKKRRILTPSLEKMYTTFYGAKRGVTYYVKVQKLTPTSSGFYHVKFE